MDITSNKPQGTNELTPFEWYARQILDVFDAAKDFRSKCEIEEAVENLSKLEKEARAQGIGQNEPRYFPQMPDRNLSHAGSRLHEALDELETNLQSILEGDELDGKMACDNLFSYEGRKWLLSQMAATSPWIAVAYRRAKGDWDERLPEIAALGGHVELNNEIWTELWFDSTGEWGSSERGHINVDAANWPPLAFRVIEGNDMDRYQIALALSKIKAPTDADVLEIMDSFGLE